ncbi:MAG: hypothetical protein ACQESR_06855 [Planctomycetota bacterium]
MAQSSSVEWQSDGDIGDEKPSRTEPSGKASSPKAETEKTDPAKMAKNENPTNSRLRFFPPNIGKKTVTRSDAEKTAMARQADEGREGNESSDTSSGKQVVANRGAETIPRREDMMPSGRTFLARQSRPKENELRESDEPESPSSSASKSDASAPQTKWVAKKERAEAESAKSVRIAKNDSDLESEQGEDALRQTPFQAKTPRRQWSNKGASATANQPTGSPRVVADTFANHNARRPTQRTSPRPSRQADSSAARSSQPSESPEATAAASRYVRNPHAAENRNSKSGGSAQGDTASNGPSEQTARSKAPQSGAVARNAASGQSGQNASATSIRQATAGGAAARSVKRDNGLNAKTPRRHGWRPPVPVASRRSSVSSYYHRGVLPGATSLTRSPRQAQASTGLAPQNNHANSATQPAQHLAPLVDAHTYRRRMAQVQQQGRSSIDRSGTEPRNTWVGTYKELLRQNTGSRQGSAHPEAGTTQPLRSR